MAYCLVGGLSYLHSKFGLTNRSVQSKWPGDGITQSVSPQPFRRFAVFSFIRSIVPDLPFRGIEVNLVVSSSFLDSNRYGSAPFALILDFPLIISISVKQCSTVGAIHRYRCPIIICHAHHLIKFLDAFGVTVAAQKCCPYHIALDVHQ